MATDLKRDLQAVNRELKALSKKVEKLVAAAAKAEKPKAVRRTVAKRTVAKKAARPSTRKPATKKKREATAIDTVLGIINRSRKGVGVAALKERTGFKEQKIYGIVKALKTKGKIRSERIGVYVKT